MEPATGIGHGRDLAVNGDSVGFWWPERSTQVAWPPNGHDTPASTQLTDQIPPDSPEGEPTERIRSTTAVLCADRHRTKPHLQPQACPFATDRIVRHLHLQRVTGPRSDRVRCLFEEDRRVHTCGSEPRGGLL